MKFSIFSLIFILLNFSSNFIYAHENSISSLYTQTHNSILQEASGSFDKIESQNVEDLYSIVEAQESIEPKKVFDVFSEINISNYILNRTKAFINLLKWHLTDEKTNQIKEKYNRKKHFGRWINDPNDSTCFNTRAQVLIRDSKTQVEYRETNRCIINSGYWIDPYTNQTLQLASDIDIDHLVPLKNAYETGAWKWNFKARCLYANYTGFENHLLSVSKFENRSKGDSSPYEYLPPIDSTVCKYIKDWLTVKSIWNLKLSTLELQGVNDAIEQSGCSKDDFKIKRSDIIKQHKIISQSMNLCERMSESKQK